MAIDNFANKSKSWDMNSKRIKSAKSVADGIIDALELNKNMKVMDFGAGTGALSYFISPLVDTIVAVDNSPSMLEKFKEKAPEFSCKTKVLELDLTATELDEKFDGIISSMTIHHIEDIKELFKKFYNMLKDGGFIAIADLDSEDGTFHSDTNGVFHFGFERKELEKIALEVGFKNVTFQLSSTIKKSNSDFSIFLMMANRD